MMQQARQQCCNTVQGKPQAVSPHDKKRKEKNPKKSGNIPDVCVIVSTTNGKPAAPTRIMQRDAAPTDGAVCTCGRKASRGRAGPVRATCRLHVTTVGPRVTPTGCSAPLAFVFPDNAAKYGVIVSAGTGSLFTNSSSALFTQLCLPTRPRQTDCAEARHTCPAAAD